MKVNEFKFRVTDTTTGASAVITLNDLFGYEGERNGVFICHNHKRKYKHIPDKLAGVQINYNSGYGYDGFNKNIEIEPVTE